jgi:hypothetical protein
MADGVIVDPLFGELTCERPWEYDHEECWRGEVRLTPKHPLRVTLRGAEPGSEAWAALSALYQRVRRAEHEIRLWAAELLLAGDDEAAWPRAAKQGLTAAAVARLIILEAVVLDADDGDATLWYENPKISSGYRASATVAPDGAVRWAGFW